MATFRTARPGNVFDPDVWELIPDEPPKRATMFTRFRRWVGRVMGYFRQADEIARLKAELAEKTEEANTLHEQLTDIGNYAHIYSTGPEVPDHLWEIRQRAYDAL